MRSMEGGIRAGTGLRVLDAIMKGRGAWDRPERIGDSRRTTADEPLARATRNMGRRRGRT
jgi:hypothetical protein